MLSTLNSSAILLLSCPDQKGLVSKLSGFIHKHNGNILSLNEYVDVEHGVFFIRIAWDISKFDLNEIDIHDVFKPLADSLQANWIINFTNKKLKTAIFVSKYDHCLQDILWRQQQDEFPIEISLIISNHEDLSKLADYYDVPFYYFPIDKSTKLEQEIQEIELLQTHDIEFIILARYMQILSSDFIKQYHHKIINIHHSFLPAFVGAQPYQQAYNKGVKIIGATSHYVTADLDEGPIIEQDVTHISHKDTVEDLVRKGRDLERVVLARAIHKHSEHRILVYGKKTVIFN